MNAPSADYVAALEASKRIHEGGKSFTGRFLRPHAGFVKEAIDRLGCTTVLDYGCGRGEQYEWVMPNRGVTIEQWWGVPVTKYDPAYPPFATEPVGKFDLVICTQTLGAIPVSDLPWVIDRLFSLAGKALYISERLDKPRKLLGDNSKRASDLGWDAHDWMDELSQSALRSGGTNIETTLATRVTDARGKITSHFRLHLNEWEDIFWPPGIHSLNHECA